MKSNVTMQISSWHPDKPTSKGAIAYHNAVANAPYYIEGLDELREIVYQNIKSGDIIVDFGSGTGSSALHLLKHIKVFIKLWLVDNSPAWLGKAYEVFSNNPNVGCFLLEKINGRYATLAETIGEGVVDHVISAHTVHLISNLEDTFKGINAALKPQGSFTFQSGNMIRDSREDGVLMIDDTIKRVHDIALEIVSKDKKFEKYRRGIDKCMENETKQRKIVFPDPRPLEHYLSALKTASFKYKEPYHKLIRIPYKDWMDFLKVKRLQAGILPEIGGKEPSPEEEKDRDELITISANQLFRELETQNPMSDERCFTVEFIYVKAIKE